jgi:hypothetical protein
MYKRRKFCQIKYIIWYFKNSWKWNCFPSGVKKHGVSRWRWKYVKKCWW